MLDDIPVKHEKELRELWEHGHENVHTLEQDARDIAFAALNQRLNVMNEFRDQINTERARYVQRDTFDTTNSSIDTRLKLLENKGSNLDGRVVIIGAVITILVSVALYVWSHR